MKQVHSSDEETIIFFDEQSRLADSNTGYLQFPNMQTKRFPKGLQKFLENLLDY